ncbi:hypothetical protein Ngar_c21430 [Candidatus Nitrososphaera gargensis Ga9.2]|uniref:Uncharacterized protein n=1 Tax=Nitrososphaera gargensis (strain Ga9.2) TaxID=1237085 RepID=K0IIZ9_NITGG|nr:hypothetical protein Ngar_c21430 [Candidatus Nitrososphaera gargensis Ga9.2]
MSLYRIKKVEHYLSNPNIAKKTRFRRGQTRWLEASLMTGLQEDNFLIVEWKFPDES